MRFLLLLPLLLTTTLSQAQQAESAAATTTALDRILDAALKSASWPISRTQSARLTLLREKALVYKAETTPVADRFIITALAGPIDLVHFFGLARNVCSGRERRAGLYREWQREGGPLYITKQTQEGSTDCTPDDLPSNALGALFGEETLPHEADMNHDLIASLRQFFAKLEPVSDAVAKSLSHESAVLGLTPESSKQDIRARHEWFTAMPIYLIPLVAPDRAATIPDAAAALTAAGFMLRQHEGQPIVLDRVGSPEPAPAPPKPHPPEPRPPEPSPRVVKAVPVDEPAPRPPTKAVPVD